MSAQKILVRDALSVWHSQQSFSLDSGLKCEDPSLAIQSQEADANINNIMERFGITGQLPQGVRAPTFQDFGDQIFDFRSAVEQIAMAEDAFMCMPARVRSRFDNDPQKFVEFCSDEANAKEMRELGLLKPEVVPPKEVIQKVEIVNSGGGALPDTAK